MKKQYKIQLPKGKKVTMTNVDFDDGVMTVNIELENREDPISEAEEVIRHLRSIDWNKRTKESIDRIYDELYHKEHPETISNYKRWKRKFGDINEQKYEPKDGDFIALKWKCNAHLIPTWDDENDTIERDAIAIFKEIKKCGDRYVLFCYISYFPDDVLNIQSLFLLGKINGCEISLGEISKFDDIRPATEEEKKLLIDKLAARNKKWNAEIKQIVDVRWRAKKYEPYYYIIALEYIIETTDERLACDDSRYCTNNYFKTREAAEKVMAKMREIFKNSKVE